jgi:hypothetical protein
MISEYIVFFAAFTLIVILYVAYYNEFVFAPKVKKLNLANEFRYAKNLNTALIQQFSENEYLLQNAGGLLNGLGYDAVMAKLQTWHDMVYTDATFKMLCGKKTNKNIINSLEAELNHQIKIQHEVKANFNNAINRRNRLYAA